MTVGEISSSFQGRIETVLSIRKCSTLFGNFHNCPETFLNCLGTFQIVQKIWRFFKLSACLNFFSDYPKTLETRPNGNFPGNLEFFKIIVKFSRPLGHFPYHLETFRTIWKFSIPKLFIVSDNFPDHLETLWIIKKISRPCGNFLSYPTTFQTIWKLYGSLRNFLDHLESLQIIGELSRQNSPTFRILYAKMYTGLKKVHYHW